MSEDRLDQIRSIRARYGSRPECPESIGAVVVDLLAEVERLRAQTASMRDRATLAVARAVDAALGEVARQQGWIAPNVAAEARTDGIASGLALVLDAGRIAAPSGAST